jgi:drug/metabolite transporter (DMT)-like permease
MIHVYHVVNLYDLPYEARETQLSSQQRKSGDMSTNSRRFNPFPLPISSRVPAALALIVANMMFGASIVAGKVVLEDTRPITLALMRVAIAAVVLLILTWRSGGRPLLNRTTLVMGLFGVTLFFVPYHLGIHYTSATNATLILDGGEPIATAALAALVLQERMTRRFVAGLIAALLGIVAIVLLGEGVNFSTSFFGDLLVLGSAVAWASYLVAGRNAFQRHGLIEVVTGATIVGLVTLIPFAAIEIALQGIGSVSSFDLVLIMYLGAGCSALTYVLLGFGLRHFDAGPSAVFGNLAPLTGLSAAFFLLHESIKPAQLFGGALIVLGIWLATSIGKQRGTTSTMPVAEILVPDLVPIPDDHA